MNNKDKAARIKEAMTKQAPGLNFALWTDDDLRRFIHLTIDFGNRERTPLEADAINTLIEKYTSKEL